MELNSEMNRRKKIKIVQISLFLLGILIIYSTYYGENLNLKKGSISDITKKKNNKRFKRI